MKKQSLLLILTLFMWGCANDVAELEAPLEEDALAYIEKQEIIYEPIPLLLTVQQYRDFAKTLEWDLQVALFDWNQNVLEEAPSSYFISFSGHGYTNSAENLLWLELVPLEDFSEQERLAALQRLEHRLQLVNQQLFLLSDASPSEESAYCIQADLDGCQEHPLEIAFQSLMELWHELSGEEAFG